MNFNKRIYFLEQSSKEKSLGSRNIKESAKDKCRQHERAQVAWPKGMTPEADRSRLRRQIRNPRRITNHWLKDGLKRWTSEICGIAPGIGCCYW